MPIPTSAYGIFSDVSSRLRVIVLDSEIPGGDILTDPGSATGSPFVTTQIINSAFERVQSELYKVGIETYIEEGWLIGLPFVPTVDPEARMIVDDTGCNIEYPNGVGNVYSLTPQLPVDLIEPLKLWERQNGSTDNVVPMRQPNTGLFDMSQQTFLIDWEWMTDGIRFRGALQSQDVKIKYRKKMPQLVAATDPVPIRGVINAAAYQGARIFAATRAGAILPEFKMQADEEIALLQYAAARRRQRKQVRRRGYSSRGSHY